MQELHQSVSELGGLTILAETLNAVVEHALLNAPNINCSILLDEIMVEVDAIVTNVLDVEV